MVSKQSAEWAVLIITFIFASIAIFLRLHSRHLTKAYFWWDDAFAICCYVSYHPHKWRTVEQG